LSSTQDFVTSQQRQPLLKICCGNESKKFEGKKKLRKRHRQTAREWCHSQRRQELCNRFPKFN